MMRASAFPGRSFVDAARRIRGNSVAACGIAIAAVAIATLLRWALGPYLMEGVPFVSYFLAVLVTTLLGGLWPGLVALILSAISAWLLFIPPEFTFALTAPDLVSLLLFLLVGSAIVALAALLNKVVDRLFVQEQNIRALLESTPEGIVVVDRSGVITTVNRSTEELFGYERVELLGQPIEVLVPDAKAATHKAERESYQRRPETRPMGAGRELSGRRKDGSEFPVEITLSLVSRIGDDAVLATVADISARKEAQERQQFLIGELQHRSQNLFAVIQAIAVRSLDETRTAAEAKRVFEGRLQALAQAHRMLAEGAWEGALLADIINQELDAYSKRMSVSGCDLFVNTLAAQQFAMVIHELATNAAKHGALSAPEGRVSIEGKTEKANGDTVFSLLWKESGGPPVSKPKRKGFGSVILIDSAKQFGSRPTLKFETEGLRYSLTVPVTSIAPARSSRRFELRN